jgi:hypothetical protein
MFTYDFELIITGLCVLTFHGQDKRQPDQVNVLLVKTDPPGEDAHAGHAEHHKHPQHFPQLSFTTARDARPATDSDARFSLVPTPDGHQLGIAELGGVVSLAFDDKEENVPEPLTAYWRPAGKPDGLAPDQNDADEQAWLNWVPLLKKVNPGLKAPTEEAPFAGLRADRVIARLALTRGELKAANLIRKPNGQFRIWDFKPPGAVQPFARQAMAAAAVLRFQRLSQPVWFEGETIGRLGLMGQRQDELVRASITNLPRENVSLGTRLVHFAQFYELFDESPRVQSLPEFDEHLFTSVGVDCPCALHAVVPDVK